MRNNAYMLWTVGSCRGGAFRQDTSILRQRWHRTVGIGGIGPTPAGILVLGRHHGTPYTSFWHLGSVGARETAAHGTVQICNNDGRPWHQEKGPPHCCAHLVMWPPRAANKNKKEGSTMAQESSMAAQDG